MADNGIYSYFCFLISRFILLLIYIPSSTQTYPYINIYITRFSIRSFVFWIIKLCARNGKKTNIYKYRKLVIIAFHKRIPDICIYLLYTTRQPYRVRGRERDRETLTHPFKQWTIFSFSLIIINVFIMIIIIIIMIHDYHDSYISVGHFFSDFHCSFFGIDFLFLSFSAFPHHYNSDNPN